MMLLELLVDQMVPLSESYHWYQSVVELLSVVCSIDRLPNDVIFRFGWNGKLNDALLAAYIDVRTSF